MSTQKKPTKKAAPKEAASYIVLIDFKDLQDGEFLYKAGDTYPREGVKPTTARIKQLSGSDNNFKRPIIEKK